MLIEIASDLQLADLALSPTLSRNPSWLWQPLNIALFVSPLALLTPINLLAKNLPYASSLRVRI
jgi:hypothetical protein